MVDTPFLCDGDKLAMEDEPSKHDKRRALYTIM